VITVYNMPTVVNNNKKCGPIGLYDMTI